MENFSKYEDLLDKAMGYYCKDEDYVTYFGRVPKTRAETFKYCLEYLDKLETTDIINVVELGTSRSFVDGRFLGCNSDNLSFWEPNNPFVWDWSAGKFTHVFSECTRPNVLLHTIDIVPNHIERSKIMTEPFKHKIQYYAMPSEHFLSNCNSKAIDLLYLDTGDVNPVEPTAQLHLREAQIIVEKDLLKDGGLILIDDVRNLASKMDAKEESDFGKAKYSIPYFLEHGYEIIMDEYQVILKKKETA
jgi:hypothetical protein